MRILLVLLLSVVSISLCAQNKGRDGTGFKSVFSKNLNGNFKGQASGLLYIKIANEKDTIYSFMEEIASLDIKNDPDSIYDISSKHYSVTLSSIKIEYTTYALANCLGITINGNTYWVDFIDGACIGVIDGLEWSYIADKEKELLFLYFSNDVSLHKKRTRIWDMFIQKGSILCFNIKR